jgi:molybdopterin-synthase adenylyltransferase
MENAAFALCGFSKRANETRLLVRTILTVPLHAYVVRNEVHLEVSPGFVNGVIDAASGKFAILIIHSHRGAVYPRYSSSDDFGETRLFDVFSALVPGVPHASLLLTDNKLTGRYWSKSRFYPITSVRVVGNRLMKVSIKDDPGLSKEEGLTYDRQISAFGADFQRTLKEMTVGIVGLGGTGSAVAEQLARLGVTNFVFVDLDVLEPSNLTRTYGTFRKSSLGMSKTSLTRTHLKKINPDTRITEVRDSIVRQEVLEKLTGCDFVFSCTDNDWSRSIINRFAFQYLIPTVDMGVSIDVDRGSVIGAAGRVSMIGPGFPCLWCGHHLDSERIRAESMESKERERLVKEKYIRGVDSKAPSVISFNTTLAGMGVTVLLSCIAGFSAVPSESPDQVYDILEGTVFRAKATANPTCKICGPGGLKGLGSIQRISAYD